MPYESLAVPIGFVPTAPQCKVALFMIAFGGNTKTAVLFASAGTNFF